MASMFQGRYKMKSMVSAFRGRHKGEDMISVSREEYKTKNIVSMFLEKHKNNGMALAVELGSLILLWGLAVYGMAAQFFSQSVPFYREVLINGDSAQTTQQLHPQDVLWQTFRMDADHLESMSIAFDYEDSARDAGRLIVRFYHDDICVIEQPLPLAACPQKSFLEFHLGLQDCKGDELHVQIVNVSEEAAGVFSLLETRDMYTYGHYSDGYLLNDAGAADGSILCSLKFGNGRHYYRGLTYAFWIFLASMILSCFIVRGFAWRQQHKSH